MQPIISYGGRNLIHYNRSLTTACGGGGGGCWLDVEAFSMFDVWDGPGCTCCPYQQRACLTKLAFLTIYWEKLVGEWECQESKFALAVSEMIVLWAWAYGIELSCHLTTF